MTDSASDREKTSIILSVHASIHCSIDHLDRLLSCYITDWHFRQSVHDIAPSPDIAAGRKILDIIKDIER